MFRSRYPQARLTRIRILCSHGEPRGVSIIPKPFSPPLPGEIKHRHSCIVPLPRPGKIMVIEWTGGDTDLHLIDF